MIERNGGTRVADLYRKFSELRLQHGFLLPAKHVVLVILVYMTSSTQPKSI